MNGSGYEEEAMKEITYRRSPDTLHAVVGEQVLTMSIQTMASFQFDSLGSRVWELLDGSPKTLDALCGTLLEEYDVSEDQCRTAVQSFLDKGIEQGLVAAE